MRCEGSEYLTLPRRGQHVARHLRATPEASVSDTPQHCFCRTFGITNLRSAGEILKTPHHRRQNNCRRKLANAREIEPPSSGHFVLRSQTERLHHYRRLE